jgi:hypothetical protein
MQAQEAPAAALAVRVRSRGLTGAAVEAARVTARTVVRTWAMRGTLHLVATEDLGWLLPLLGPPFVRAMRRRRLELGLDEATCTRGLQLLRAALSARGPLTRAEVVEQLAGHGLPLVGQAAPHLLGRAALEGLICYGPNRGREPTYVLLDDWVPLGRALAPEAARAELVRRYLAAFGPATPEDWAAWSGLPLTTGRAAWQALAGELTEVALDSGPAWLLTARRAWLDDPPSSGPVVRLLGGYDTYLLGYRRRGGVLDPAHARQVHPGGGVIRPALLVDGRVVGTWRITRSKAGPAVAVAPFAALPTAVQPGLDAEIADVTRFLRDEG